MVKPRILAVILAAGDSVRFKPGPKALPPPRGAGLLGLCAGSLGLLGFAEPLVIVNPRQPEVIALSRELGCRAVVNPSPERGMFSSFRLVFEGAPGEAALVLPVDAGFVTADSILSVIAHFLGLGGRDGLAVLPAHGGRLGHPPVIGADLVARILAGDGEGGLRGALARAAGDGGAAVMGALRPGGSGEAGALRFLDVADPLVLTDIDTRGDLGTFEAIRDKSTFRPAVTPGKALALLALAGPERKFRHALAVAVAALRLAGALAPGACELAFAGGLLHDLCHGERDHAGKAAERVTALGWEAPLAAVVGAHTELPEPLRAMIGLAPRGPGGGGEWDRDTAMAAFCVHLADKYVKGPRLVGLAARFDPRWARDRPGVRPFIEARKADALALDAWVRARVGEGIEGILTGPGGSGLERLADGAAGCPAGPT
ncbi:MAG: NTP transferase domain-containing protein [Deltaproteobacteria bacterium]|jgi:CTP:molybdopterin cytidylyltransferase MocA|nr:NTP transferase domain-containing protein [Deltaproteobacteria bacterium]